ncbi:MAG TPA: hypothetical protein VN524_19400 [Hyphomicrobiaceae bacterium]|nr:hypothetical protein [Hyphomicrobiaceae bacterium]
MPTTTDQVWALDTLPAAAGVTGTDTLALLASGVTVRATVSDLLGVVWPVGSVFTGVVATNPATLLGFGTWAALGAGRVLVGVDAADPDFDTAEETGGAKTVTVAAHASHTHTYTQVPNHVHALATGTGSTGNFSQVLGTVDASSGGTGATPTQTALGTLSANPTGGVATGTTAGPGAALTHAAASIVQPYLAVYFWKRTA